MCEGWVRSQGRFLSMDACAYGCVRDEGGRGGRWRGWMGVCLGRGGGGWAVGGWVGSGGGGKGGGGRCLAVVSLLRTCSIGVIPVPPAIIPTRDAFISLAPTLKRPLPKYSFIPQGPEMVMVSPT